MTKLEFYKLGRDIQKIGTRAVRKAQAENHAKGLPNVYCKNGVTYWQLPDGTITMQNPIKDTQSAAS